MFARILTALRALLVAGDVLLCVLWVLPKYILFGGEKPNGRQTISARIGRSYALEKWWAKPIMKTLDWIFERLGDGENHCLRAFLFEVNRGLISPVAGR